jgi:hypothetical protein
MPRTKPHSKAITTYSRLHPFVAFFISSVLIISLFPPLELIDYVYWEFTANFNVAPEVFIMSSDILLLLAGFLLVHSIKEFLSTRAIQSELNSLGRLNRKGIPSLTAAILIIAYWHVPVVLDSALLSFPLHVVMHFALLVAGGLIYVGTSPLTRRQRRIASILGCKAMGIYGVFLLVTSGAGYSRFYSVYPLNQQAQLGLSMMVMMFVFESLLIPYWLYQYFTSP